MRTTAGLLSILILSAAACVARAESPVADATAQSALFRAVFVADAASSYAAPASQSELTDVTGAVFAPAPDHARLLAPEQPVPGQGLAEWRSRALVLPPTAGGAVDTLRVSLGSLAYAPGGVVLARPDSLIGRDTQAFDLNYTRGWPGALKLSAAGYDLDVTPHAGVGVSSDGGSAEAGATVRFGSDLQQKVMSGLSGLGVRTVPSQSLRDRGRWYLFAAASGRAVGMNVGRGPQGGLQRLGWSAEATSMLISDAQAGIAWRKGDTEASLGYVHREIRGDFGDSANPGDVRDSMVAVSFTLRHN